MIDEKDILAILQDMIKDFNNYKALEATEIALLEQANEIFKDDEGGF